MSSIVLCAYYYFLINIFNWGSFFFLSSNWNVAYFFHLHYLNFISIYYLLSDGEIDYVRVINRVLPNDIRVLGWCTVPVGFSARFVLLVIFFFFFLYRFGYFRFLERNVMC